MKRIPIVATHFKVTDIIYSVVSSIFNRTFKEKFSNELKKISNYKYCFLFNYGRTAFYVALKSLKSLSNRKEVIIPAYTALPLVNCIKNSGLKVVLCDISLKTLNLEVSELKKRINKNTLCIVPVYLCGIYNSINDILKIAQENNSFVIEDCAQSFLTGSKEKGDLVLLSFNRGKNFATFSGGALLGNDEKIFKSIKDNITGIKNQSFKTKINTLLKFICFSFMKNKYIYGVLYELIKKIKDYKTNFDIEIEDYTNWQSILAIKFLDKNDEFNKIRYSNAMKIIETLKSYEYFLIPHIDINSKINRFPLIVKDLKIKEKMVNNLIKVGIDAPTVYHQAVHCHVDLGYKKQEFPNVIYLAEHLITLPVHPLVTTNEIDFITGEIKKCFL